MVEEVRVVRPIDAMEMKAKQVRALGLQSVDLALVQIRNERQVIIFRKVNELKLLVRRSSRIPPLSGTSVYSFEIRVDDPAFASADLQHGISACVRSRRIPSESAVSEQDALIRHAFSSNTPTSLSRPPPTGAKGANLGRESCGVKGKGGQSSVFQVSVIFPATFHLISFVLQIALILASSESSWHFGPMGSESDPHGQ